MISKSFVIFSNLLIYLVLFQENLAWSVTISDASDTLQPMWFLDISPLLAPKTEMKIIFYNFTKTSCLTIWCPIFNISLIHSLGSTLISCDTLPLIPDTMSDVNPEKLFRPACITRCPLSFFIVRSLQVLKFIFRFDRFSLIHLFDTCCPTWECVSLNFICKEVITWNPFNVCNKNYSSPVVIIFPNILRYENRLSSDENLLYFFTCTTVQSGFIWDALTLFQNMNN
jgi:hypothetical protein